jgi:hypothetical protein
MGMTMQLSQNIKALALVALVWMATSVGVWGQRPQWVGNTPKELNYTYKFVEIVSTGSSLESARAEAKDRLTDDSQLQEGIRVYLSTKETTSIDKVRTSGSGLRETVKNHIDVTLTVDGEKFDVQAVRVDEYPIYKDGLYTLHTLYMVALCENPVFDRTYLTTSYGAAPVAMSIIPGVGQWYKGSRVKGSCMFVAEAAAVAGIIVCDNQRASYVKKAKEQPKFAKEYSSKADNWETSRNVCIGVAAGVWIWNIVDAAVAKGGRRVVVTRADGGGMSFTPMVSPDAAGVALAYRF